MLPIGWAALIFFFSTGAFANTNTKLILVEALSMFHLQFSASMVDTLNFLCGKTAHTSNYAVLALFLYFGFSREGRLSWNPRRALACILVASLYSMTDEFHQIFVKGRSGDFGDCAIDTAGAVIGMVIVYLDSRLFSSRNPKTEQPASGSN